MFNKNYRIKTSQNIAVFRACLLWWQTVISVVVVRILILPYHLTGARLINNIILFFPELWLKQMLNMHQQGRQWKKPLKGNTRFSLQVSQHHWPFLDYQYLHFCDLAVWGSSVSFIRFQCSQLAVPPRPLYINLVHFRWPPCSWRIPSGDKKLLCPGAQHHDLG